MAMFVPCNGPVEHGIDVPLWPNTIRIMVGGDYRMAELESGDCLLYNPDVQIENVTASAFAGEPICGDVIMCREEEVA